MIKHSRQGRGLSGSQNLVATVLQGSFPSLFLIVIADFFFSQRLDGSIKGEIRKQALDHFNADGSEVCQMGLPFLQRGLVGGRRELAQFIPSSRTPGPF